MARSYIQHLAITIFCSTIARMALTSLLICCSLCSWESRLVWGSVVVMRLCTTNRFQWLHTCVCLRLCCDCCFDSQLCPWYSVSSTIFACVTRPKGYINHSKIIWTVTEMFLRCFVKPRKLLCSSLWWVFDKNGEPCWDLLVSTFCFPSSQSFTRVLGTGPRILEQLLHAHMHMRHMNLQMA